MRSSIRIIGYRVGVKDIPHIEDASLTDRDGYLLLPHIT